MLLRPFLNDATSCASYLFGCGTHAKLAVVDSHAELVDDYLATADERRNRCGHRRVRRRDCQSGRLANGLRQFSALPSRRAP